MSACLKRLLLGPGILTPVCWMSTSTRTSFNTGGQVRLPQPAERRRRLGRPVHAAQTLVIVESPTKARKIGEFLGEGYVVKASYGHVRQLDRANGVDPAEQFRMRWAFTERARGVLPELESLLADSQRLILATDPDREGEAISWHLLELFKGKAALDGRSVARVAFNEITRDAVLAAMAAPRDVSQPLVDAYLARLAVDYLLGFTLSPVLWRKLPGPKSAGRVQSVALRLICELEAQLEAFRPQPYYSVAATLTLPSGRLVVAALTSSDGVLVSKRQDGGLDREAADRAVQALQDAGCVVVTDVKKGTRKSGPSPPFTTSSLQQDAARWLGFSASKTMSTAQYLFEEGFSTYHRTDGVSVSLERIGVIRSAVERHFEPALLPGAPRVYKSKAKNAQESHEAIVSTDVLDRPELPPLGSASPAARWLYRLIWLRTMACQMSDALYETARVQLRSGDAQQLAISVSRLDHQGYLAAWQQAGSIRSARDADPEDDAPAGDEDDGGRQPGAPSSDDDDVAAAAAADDNGAFEELSALRPGTTLPLVACEVSEHWTSLRGRFSEASLVKRLEELGIGRPSTYAGILKTLIDREYVIKQGRSLVPTGKGRILAVFLETFFPRWVDYNYTCDMEAGLDEISAGGRDRLDLLDAFWRQLTESVREMQDVTVSSVLQTLEDRLAVSLFPPRDDGTDSQACPVCGDGKLHLRLSRAGGFVGCSNYRREGAGEGGGEGEGAKAPCTYKRPLSFSADANLAQMSDTLLGVHPETGRPVQLRFGPYGWFVETQLDSGDMRRTALLVKEEPASVTLERALELLAGPMVLGTHPVTGLPIEIRTGQFGPYFQHGSLSRSLGKRLSPADATLDDAIASLDIKANKLGMSQAEAALARKSATRGGGRSKSQGPSAVAVHHAFVRTWREANGGDLAAARQAWKELGADERAAFKRELAAAPAAEPPKGKAPKKKGRQSESAAVADAAQPKGQRGRRAKEPRQPESDGTVQNGADDGASETSEVGKRGDGLATYREFCRVHRAEHGSSPSHARLQWHALGKAGQAEFKQSLAAQLPVSV